MANGRSGWGVSLCALALAKGAILSSDRFDRTGPSADDRPEDATDPSAAVGDDQTLDASSRTGETS